MRWLIVEDALRDRKGHWFEYVRTFRKGLLELGDEVTVLADKNAEPFIKTELEAQAILPESIWHRMSSGGALKRMSRIPIHALKTRRCVARWLQAHEEYDIIFVPTVSVHHLLAWASLIRGRLLHRHTRVLLYFLSTPTKTQANGPPTWDNSATSRLLARLLKRLRASVEQGKVFLGVETVPLRDALAHLTGLPVLYLPQPVDRLPAKHDSIQDELRMACYGGARHEKGSDILQHAIRKYLEAFPESRAKFVIQWLDNFNDESGKTIGKDPTLLTNPRVEFISHYFQNGEYAERLRTTGVMLLPYRLSSYQLRGSRVALESMVDGIPMVITRGTAAARQAEEFGASVLCKDGDAESLVCAIRETEQRFQELRQLAEERKVMAQQHFSVRNFHDIMLTFLAKAEMSST